MDWHSLCSLHIQRCIHQQSGLVEQNYGFGTDMRKVENFYVSSLNCKTLRQPLLGELAMSREKEREKNALYSGHLRLCQQPRAAHALRSDQQKLFLISADKLALS